MKSSTLSWAGVGVWCASVAAGVVACDGGNHQSVSQGALRVALTDAPACGLEHAWVTIDKVRVHQRSTASDADPGWAEVTLTPPRRVDLLRLTNGTLEELGTTPLPTGSYSQLRLVLSDNSPGAAVMANAVQPPGAAAVALSTPSAQQSGLKLRARFDVTAGQLADLVLDFDACKSIVKTGDSGQYTLNPVVNVMPRG